MPEVVAEVHYDKCLDNTMLKGQPASNSQATIKIDISSLHNRHKERQDSQVANHEDTGTNR